MFVGHFALGYAAKRAAPRLSLAVLIAAAQLADLLWPALVALGIEHVRIDPGNTAVTPLDFVSYPYSHSLLLLAIWGVLFGLVVRMFAAGRRVFLVVFGLVVSHWVLDVVAHRPDMPLYPGGPKLGLGLWNSVAGTACVELAMYAVGLWIYWRATRARDAVGRWASALLAIFLAAIYVVNLTSPPPPSVTVVWIAGLAGGAIVVLWSWWADAHRAPVV